MHYAGLYDGIGMSAHVVSIIHFSSSHSIIIHSTLSPFIVPGGDWKWLNDEKRKKDFVLYYSHET